MMTTVFKTPVSLITLVADPSRVWFKSCVGPFGACVDRDGSWCNYVLVPPTPEVLVTEDASKDARFAHNPYVAGEPFIKFYAGAPLVGSKGERYGTLCIVDLVERAFTAELYALLINFAITVVPGALVAFVGYMVYSRRERMSPKAWGGVAVLVGWRLRRLGLLLGDLLRLQDGRAHV